MKKLECKTVKISSDFPNENLLDDLSRTGWEIKAILQTSESSGIIYLQREREIQ